MSTPVEGPEQGGTLTLDRELEELLREENIELGDHERFSALRQEGQDPRVGDHRQAGARAVRQEVDAGP